jgi:hypothetical protein
LLVTASIMLLSSSCASTSATPDTPSTRLTVHGTPYVSAISLFAKGSPVSAREIGLQLIQRRLGPDCPFQILQTINSGIGTNGHFSYLWRTSTCRGETFFDFNYWPPDFFPDLPGPYELKELVPEAGPKAGGFPSRN